MTKNQLKALANKEISLPLTPVDINLIYLDKDLLDTHKKFRILTKVEWKKNKTWIYWYWKPEGVKDCGYSGVCVSYLDEFII